MVRTILCILGGVVVGVLCVFAVDLLSMKLFPPPPGVNPSDEAQLRQALAAGRIPKGALICVLSGQVLGALAASFIAARCSRRFKVSAGGIAGAFLFAGAIVNLKSLPHPMYFNVTTLVTIPAAICLGIILGSRRADDIVATTSPAASR
jgi:hypothetical protein